MNQKTINIRVLDQDSRDNNKSTILRLIGDNPDFSLSFANNISELNAPEQPSDLFILKLKNFKDIDLNSFKIFKDYCNNNNLPFVLVYRFKDFKQFFYSFELGFELFISLPTNKKFFGERINEIITYHVSKNSMDKKQKINYKYFLYLNNLKAKKNMSDFVFSLLNDSFYNSRMIEFLNKHIINNKNNHIQEKNKKSESLNVDNSYLDELYDAFEKKQFVLYYQPIIEVESNNLVGFESLIRWHHPEKGVISPDDFIPTIENSDLIIPVGFWIIEEASRVLSEWKVNFDIKIKIDVNLSVKQFLHPKLAEIIFKITEKFDIDNELLAFELTESAFMEDMDAANIALLKLKSKRFPLYMDDFGTGYSSLTYLMHFPMDILKIDKSFVEFMNIDEQSEEIVRSIIAMAHNLKMKVIAEGIENEEHWNMLKALNCDYSQGYFHSKPLSKEDAEDFIRRFI